METLASLQDAFDRLGTSLDTDAAARLYVLLEDASAAIRLYTGQDFTRQSRVDLVKPDCGRIRLSQRPVISITSLTDKDARDVSYSWDGKSMLYVNGINALNIWELVPYRNPSTDWLTVTYECGYEVIPAPVVAVCCQMALRAHGKSPTTTGYQSEVIMGYNYTLGQAAAAGGVGVLPQEKELLSKYQNPIARTIRLG